MKLNPHFAQGTPIAERRPSSLSDATVRDAIERSEEFRGAELVAVRVILQVDLKEAPAAHRTIEAGADIPARTPVTVSRKRTPQWHHDQMLKGGVLRYLVKRLEVR